MEPKKNLLSKFRERTKPLFNVKIGKKAKKTPLKYRRSISVPDLRLGQSMPPELDSIAQSLEPDSASFTEHDGSDSETSSVAYSDKLTFTDQFLDTASSAWSVDRHSLQDTPFSSGLQEKHTAQDTSYTNQYTTPYTPSATKHLDQLTASSTPSATKVRDHFTFPDIPASPKLSVSDVPSASARPAVLDVPITSDRSDRRTTEQESRSTWYVGEQDNDSDCSSPSEEQSFPWCNDPELTEFMTHRSTEMCITGSAEDMNEVSTVYTRHYYTIPS